MAHGAPDWTRKVEIVITAAQPAIERSAGDAGRYAGTDTSYQEVASWTVATGYTGELKEIIILSSTYSKANYQVTVGAITWTTDWVAQGAMPIIFEDLRLAAGTVVKVEAKSTDGTSITVDAVIVGKEVAI